MTELNAKVTLVATVKDAAGEVGEFLASVAAQTRPPDEIVICDGGSTDGTVDVLRAADGVTLLEETGANIARGRNLAIRAATHDLIAVSDADCVLAPGWLEALLGALDRGADVAMGDVRAADAVAVPGSRGGHRGPGPVRAARGAVHALRPVGGVPAVGVRGGGRLPGMARHRRGHVREPPVA